MKLLAIETSCDETAAAVVENGRRILSNVVSSQVEFHKKHGGVVPEIAARKHLELLNLAVAEALDQAKCRWPDLSSIAVTKNPGLPGALLVGLTAARVLAASQDLPLYEVDHVLGHLYANFLIPEKADLGSKSTKNFQEHPAFPFLCLVVSGGHTDLILSRKQGQFKFLGRTRDDAAGEAFDKIARFFDLGYPGGPALDKMARQGDRRAVKFPRPYLPDSHDFSFSGLKTAVVNWAHQQKGRRFCLPDVLASFQEAVVDVLAAKLAWAAEAAKVKNIGLAGGVACNSRLREVVEDLARQKKWRLFIPPPVLCTDNAAMIAAAAYYLN